MHLTIMSKEKQTRKRPEPAKLQDYALSHRTGAASENNTSNTIEYWCTTCSLFKNNYKFRKTFFGRKLRAGRICGQLFKLG